MGSFTPTGMSKAMSLGQQGPPGTPTSTEVRIGEAQGEDHPVDLVAETDQGQGVIGTVWREVSGAWKVNDIEIKKMP